MQVENLVNIELSYINTKHPDFTEAGLVHKALTDSLEPDMRKVAIQAPNQTPQIQGIPQKQVGAGEDRVCGVGQSFTCLALVPLYFSVSLRFYLKLYQDFS